MGAQRTFGALYDVLKEREGLETTIPDIMARTGLRRDQVFNAVNTLKRQGRPVETHVAGHSFILRREAPLTKEKRVFEEIGTAKNGDIVIQDEDGNLYKATRI